MSRALQLVTMAALIASGRDVRFGPDVSRVSGDEPILLVGGGDPLEPTPEPAVRLISFTPPKQGPRRPATAEADNAAIAAAEAKRARKAAKRMRQEATNG